jgi:hypothetical protein
MDQRKDIITGINENDLTLIWKNCLCLEKKLKGNLGYRYGFNR